ncbi:YjcG family protein [Bacillus thermotolerans]|uniref:Putative phosphoesterase QY95_01322 n=1 Tax=Bacillus thermotolerans TaxID=1221996 RepID=A0A0F5I5K9_BACTR|nr:YjcG family protein [Bacillus thermotolerans]KKB38086.1 2H phosphoesterase family protein [Bacillus thermotolerans]KKB40748.1 2H phosphoesterase, YjcG family [Bacillus thermotolerans]KKB41664.1 2H phosphoesterase superfamily protein [Bacillus thermotolerans]
MKLGVVIFPSKKLQDLANSYRKRYDTHYSLVPPHITVKEPFEAEESDLKDLTAQLSEVAKKHAPFSFHVSKVKSFHPVNNVVYFKVDPIDQLTALHEDLSSESMIGGKPQYAFIPHLTIAQDLSTTEHDDVYNSLQMLSIDHEETTDRFHLLYQLDNGSWTVYETFVLGKG